MIVLLKGRKGGPDLSVSAWRALRLEPGALLPAVGDLVTIADGWCGARVAERFFGEDLGSVELQLDEKPIDDGELAPGWHRTLAGALHAIGEIEEVADGPAT